MVLPSLPGVPAERSAALRAAAIVLGSLTLATGASVVLEGYVGVADASPVYLLAVVVVASLYGTWPAIGMSAGSFLLYDFLFTGPRYTFAVSDPAEWLSLLLFLSIAVVIGRLAALLRERAEVADRRSRESVSLAAIGRAIAMATSFEEAGPAVSERLRIDAEMDTVRIDREASDSEVTTVPWRLFRSVVDGSSDWVRVVEPEDGTVLAPSGPDAAGVAFLVPIEADGQWLGSIRATRVAGSPMPGRGARRILSLAADQLGIAIRRDQLREEITSGEIARRGDALRAAILDSVSHDLRTPLATIRALAGGLADAAVHTSGADVRATAIAIDAEAERLAGLVASLLDMSRIQAGAVRPDVQPYDLAELVETAVRRRTSRDDADRVRIDIPDDLPAVGADAVLFDVALRNVVDNALRYASPPAAVVISAGPAAEARAVLLHVDDGGPGVPPDVLPHLFDRFYRVPGEAETARHGLGMGLAIARGFVEAMGGTIAASASDLGGLRLTLRLPVASARSTRTPPS